MREIKFRVWDAYTKTMIHNTVDNYLSIDNDGELNTCSILNTTIPLQYTGLKDCNGKEIYEGDVIRKGLDMSVYGVPSDIQEIVFEDGSFIGKQQKAIGYVKFVLSAYLPEIEVIGNIYENPELKSVKG